MFPGMRRASSIDLEGQRKAGLECTFEYLVVGRTEGRRTVPGAKRRLVMYSLSD